jgi:two-component system sensor histidine kinase PilS (NtrC family)
LAVSDVILGGEVRVDAKARTELGWLIGARLLLAGLSLALAVALDRIDSFDAFAAGAGISGVYWTVAGAFLATVVSGLMVSRTINPIRFATVQVAIDLTIVTALVYFSGGGDSVFTFLYALVVLYGALLLDRNGVLLTSGLAAAGYGFVLFGMEFGWLPSLGMPGRGLPVAVLGAYWGFYAGAILVLGMLANSLASELRRTGAALDRRTTDLQRLRDLHLRTVESIGSGLITTDNHGRVTSFNPEAERITGVSSREAAGQLLDEIIPGSSRILSASKKEISNATKVDRERIAYRNPLHQEEMFLGLAASSLRDEQGSEVGHVVIFQDVTDVVSMESNLRQSERLAAVGEMAARMAHEIRNPLASISGSVQLLKGEAGPGDTGPEQIRLMDIVVREVDRLNQLISDFLRYSRPAPIKPERVVLAHLVREVAEISESQNSDEVLVSLDLDPKLTVIADPSQMKAVIWNLWNNAREAMNGVGQLSARVSRVPHDGAQDDRPTGRNEQGESPEHDHDPEWTAMIEIEDSGPGVEKDALAMIFEPFFTTKRDGTGLGLATVRRIVEQHGGIIEVSSGKLGGACFRISLDCAVIEHE